MDRDDPAYRGQSDYSRAMLRLYDPLVLGPIIRYVWRFPREEGVRLYREHIRPNHLDVGPGTGYFLEHAGLPAGSKVTILDPNPNVLRHVTDRLRDLEVTAVEADVLKPLPTPGPFDSAGLSAVLHCLPGPMERKGPGDREHRPSHGARRRPLRCVCPRNVGAAHTHGQGLPLGVQQARGIRQPR